MPCRDYESDSWSHADNSSEIRKLKAQADKLARIACKAMDALTELEQEDFLLLKDDEVREWWQQHQEADRKERARVAERERRERMKAEALARLSDEEKEVLGLAPAKKSSKSKKQSGVSIAYDLETLIEVIDSHYNKWEEDNKP